MIGRLLRSTLACAIWGILICVLWVLCLGILPPPVTWVMAEQSRELGSIRREWRSLDGMSHDVPLAVIASEDQRFLHHRGFAWKAIRKAMEDNERRKGRRLKGASTISQQTAKNVFCWPGRTFLRKGLEAWFTVLIEIFWTKERIIEVYLNVAETGKGRFGVQATALRCFRHGSERMTAQEAALVAAVLPLPRKFDACAPSAYIRGRGSAIQRQMRLLGDVFDPKVMARTRERIRMEEARDRKQGR